MSWSGSSMFGQSSFFLSLKCTSLGVSPSPLQGLCQCRTAVLRISEVCHHAYSVFCLVFTFPNINIDSFFTNFIFLKDFRAVLGSQQSGEECRDSSCVPPTPRTPAQHPSAEWCGGTFDRTMSPSPGVRSAHVGRGCAFCGLVLV